MVKTEIIKVHPEFPKLEVIERCVKVIQQGGLVVFPTETVYGIAADANNPKAIKRLREVKRRSADKPFSVMVGQKDEARSYSGELKPEIFRLIDKYWPGPLTLILPGKKDAPTVGLRMPKDRVALTLVRSLNCPIAAPSANIEGNPAPGTCEEALKDLNGLVDVALDAGPALLREASTIVDCTKERPQVVRDGAIKQLDIDAVVNQKTVLMVCTGNSCRSVMAEYILREKLKDRRDVEVVSAGTNVYVIGGPSSGALKVLEKRGIDARRHQAQPLTTMMLYKSDLIFVMGQRHRSLVLESAPEVGQRVHLLKEFLFDPSVVASEELDIIDPMGQDDASYEECAKIIETALEKALKLI